jgi:hypothetical protein
MRPVLVLGLGTVLVFSAFAHAFLGWPAMRASLDAAGAPSELRDGLGVGWLFGSAAMATFGTIVLTAGNRLRRGDASGIATVRWIAICYLAFGLWAYVARGLAPHFLFFIAVGLSAGILTFGPWRVTGRMSTGGRA